MVNSDVKVLMDSEKHKNKPAKESDQPSRGKRGNIQLRVYTEIRQGLMAGAFIPGQVLTLRKFADALGTSPMPVREAIAQLVSANVLESLPNGSVAVPRLTRSRFDEITKVRQLLEGMAAVTAAQYATPALIRQLTSVNQKLLRAIEARNVLECLASNQEFHFCLYAASKSEVLLPFIESLWLQAGPMMYFSLSSPSMTWDASLHAVVIKALQENDVVAIRRAIEKDIAQTAKQVHKFGSFLGELDKVPHFHFNLE